MMRIRAEQIVYTRVEADYSARLRSGFQVVYRGEHLSQADVDHVERRVQCFQAPRSDLVRRQFFFTGSGLAAITRSIGIESDPEITDRDRRRGAFIAHCLLVNWNDLARLDNNPLPLFDACDWIGGPREMVERLGKATGFVSPASLEVMPRPVRDLSKWSLTEARKLVALALRSSELANAGRMVLLQGETASIEEALEVAFTLTPRAWRSKCTFDTVVDGCGTRAGQYWAGGVTTRHDGSAIRVNVDERRVVTQVEGHIDERDLYLKWLAHFPGNVSVAEVADRAATIQGVALAINRQGPWPSSEVDDRTAWEFLSLNRDRVQGLLERQVSSYVGSSAAAGLARHLLGQIPPLTSLRLASVSQIDGRQLCDLVADWIAVEHPDLADEDWRRLQRLARQHRCARLLWLAAVLGRNVEVSARDEALGMMTDSAFRQLLGFLCNPVVPIHFVAPNHLDALMSDSRIHNMSEYQLVQLVKALVHVDGVKHVEPLSAHVNQLGDGSLTELEIAIDEQSDLPVAFHQAMVERRNALGHPQSQSGFKDRVKGFLGMKEH